MSKTFGEQHSAMSRTVHSVASTVAAPTRYIGRFAPSPTGPLHAGSLATALASWLDARANAGQWLVRIEDVDTPRCPPGAARTILAQLATLGLHPDAEPLYQSQRSAAYQSMLNALVSQHAAFACGCTRRDIALALAHSQSQSQSERQRHSELVYPGTCRQGLQQGRSARAWRFQTGGDEQKMPLRQRLRPYVAINLIANELIEWVDRRLGPQSQNVSQAVGDFVLKRADGLWAYQLAVVVDDAAQGVTHVVRGADLLSNTARQIMLQRALGAAQPTYLHTPLVLDAEGEKLSKQNGAPAVDTAQPVAALQQAGRVLGLTENLQASTPAQWLHQSVQRWAALKIRA